MIPSAPKNSTQTLALVSPRLVNSSAEKMAKKHAGHTELKKNKSAPYRIVHFYAEHMYIFICIQNTMKFWVNKACVFLAFQKLEIKVGRWIE